MCVCVMSTEISSSMIILHDPISINSSSNRLSHNTFQPEFDPDETIFICQECKSCMARQFTWNTNDWKDWSLSKKVISQLENKNYFNRESQKKWQVMICIYACYTSWINHHINLNQSSHHRNENKGKSQLL